MALTVVDSEGEVVPNAEFRLKDKMNRPRKFAGTTNSNGVGILHGLTPGSYILTIDSPEFKPYSKAITIKDTMKKLRVKLKEEERAMGRILQADFEEPTLIEPPAAVKMPFDGDPLRHFPILNPNPPQAPRPPEPKKEEPK